MQVIQDELLAQEIEKHRALDNNQIPPPLEHFQKYIVELMPGTDPSDSSSSLSTTVSSCMREMYHYARVSGLHVLECIMDTALSAIKREQLQEASNVCIQF